MSKKLVITKGSGGYGGPLEIDVSDSAKKIMYMTGGVKPAVVDTLSEMTGLEVVNAFKKKVPDDEVAAAVVDCGGTVRCGVYPQKGIPTVNTRNTGVSGPFAKFMKPEIYVSSVMTPSQIELVEEG